MCLVSKGIGVSVPNKHHRSFLYRTLTLGKDIQRSLFSFSLSLSTLLYFYILYFWAINTFLANSSGATMHGVRSCKVFGLYLGGVCDC